MHKNPILFGWLATYVTIDFLNFFIAPHSLESVLMARDAWFHLMPVKKCMIIE